MRIPALILIVMLAQALGTTLAVSQALAASEFGHPGEDLDHLLDQAYSRFEKPKETKPLSDAEELSLLRDKVRQTNEEGFSTIIDVMVGRLHALDQEAIEAAQDRVVPYRSGDVVEGMPSPPQKRGMPQITKDARNILRYVFIQSLAVVTPARAKKWKNTLIAMGVTSAISTAITLYAILNAEDAGGAQVIAGDLITAATFGLFPGIFYMIFRNDALDARESERLVMKFADLARVRGIDWSALGINVETEFRAILEHVKETSLYTATHRRACNRLLNNTGPFASPEKIRVDASAHPVGQVRIEEFEQDPITEEAPEQTSQPQTKRTR